VVRHTSEELDELQQVLDCSVSRAGRHLRATFELPEHGLSASQLARYLEQSHVFVTIATTTASGEPRVAPVDSLFYRARFHIPTVADAVRIRHVRQRPGVSLSHFVPNEVAIIVHGTATVIAPDHPDFATLDELYQADWWQPIREQGNGVFFRIEAHVFYAWAQEPSAFSS
jgi:hypothetical protein